MNGQSLVDQIGNTPVVRLSDRVSSGANIYAKLENLNPSGSVKDRFARDAILSAEKDGRLTRDRTILEVSSGNTGISLAMVAASKGYRAHIIVPEETGERFNELIESYGANLTVVPGDIGKAHELTKDLANNPEYFYVGQADSAKPFESGIKLGEELSGQVKFDVLVGACGLGGTVCGAGSVLKRKGVEVLAVVPEENSGINGIGDFRKGFRSPSIREEIIDKIIVADTIDAITSMYDLHSYEGLLVGQSSGVAFQGALEYATRSENRDKKIMVVFSDSGDRYLGGKNA